MEGRPAGTSRLARAQAARGHCTAPAYTYSSSTAPGSTPWRTLVWRRGRRGVSEQCCEEGQTEHGTDPYEVRQYTGWHHHMLTIMLAHCFLWRLKLHLGTPPRAEACNDADPCPIVRT